jgi:hypothetical protein
MQAACPHAALGEIFQQAAKHRHPLLARCPSAHFNKLADSPWKTDRSAAQEWISLFWHEALVAQPVPALTTD